MTKQLYLTMPQPGETITEGTIVKWLVSEGAEVKEGDAIAEMETEKALFENECPFEGKIVKILHGDQSRVPVATPIAIMDVPDEKAKTYIMLGIGEEVTANGSESSSQVEASDSSFPRRRESSEAQPGSPIKSGMTDVSSSAAPAASLADVSHLKLSPFVRKLARERGIGSDVLVTLTNTEGRVTKEAILNYSESGSTQRSRGEAESVQSDKGYTVQPFSPIRMRIAENMVKSKQTIPHAHTGLTVDLTNLLKYREEHKDAFKKKHGVSLSILTLMFPALVKAIKTVPTVNASFVGEGSSAEIRIFNAINLSVAVGTESGLMTPVIKDAGNLSPADFGAKMRDVVDRANKKKLMPDDFTGTTFLFNNFGFFGLNSGVQVIQYPLAATLGMGCLEKKVEYVNGMIGVRDTANLFLAFDHRVIDGLEAGQFLTTLKEGLENFTFEY